MNQRKIQKKLRKKWLRKMHVIEHEDVDMYKINMVQTILIQRFQQFVAKQLTAKKNEKILSVGCFRGQLLASIDASTYIKGYIIDQSPKLLNMAMHQYPHFTYEILKPVINFKAGKFHRILINVPISSFHNPTELLKELKRMLKPNGSIYLYDTVEKDLLEWIQDVQLEVEMKTKYHRLHIYKVKKTNGFNTDQ